VGIITKLGSPLPKPQAITEHDAFGWTDVHRKSVNVHTHLLAMGFCNRPVYSLTKVPDLFFYRKLLRVLAIRVELVVLVSTFVVVSAVWSLYSFLFFYSRWPRAQSFVKVGPRASSASVARRLWPNTGPADLVSSALTAMQIAIKAHCLKYCTIGLRNVGTLSLD